VLQPAETFSPARSRVGSPRLWLGLLVSAVFAVLLVLHTDPSKVLGALRQANYWWVVPAVAVYFASVWVRAVRFRYIVAGVGRVSARALFPILVLGYMANNLLPARAGEFVRAYILGARHNIPKMAALGTVAVEDLFDGLTLLGFLAATVLLLGGGGALHDLTLVSIAIFAAALAVFVVALAAPDLAERLVAGSTRLPPARFRDKAHDLAWSFVEGLRSLRHPNAFAWVAGTSVAAWLMEAVAFMFVGYAFGMHIGFGWYMMAVGAGNLAIAAPSSQGGVGPFELFVKQVLVAAAVPGSVAAAYGLAVHVVILVPPTVLGLYYLWSMNLSIGCLRSMSLSLPSLRAQPVPAYAPVTIDD